MTKLFEFLDSPAGESLKASTFDIALTKHILRGPIYNADAIEIHIDVLQERFPQRFRHVVLYDPDDRFIARIHPGLFKTTLQRQKNRLMKVLNARRNEMSLQETTKTLNRVFEKPVTDWVREDWRLVQALKQPAWGNPPDPEKQVAVLSAEKKFLGTTTRSRLLNAIFHEI